MFSQEGKLLLPETVRGLITPEVNVCSAFGKTTTLFILSCLLVLEGMGCFLACCLFDKDALTSIFGAVERVQGGLFHVGTTVSASDSWIRGPLDFFPFLIVSRVLVTEG